MNFTELKILTMNFNKIFLRRFSDVSNYLKKISKTDKEVFLNNDYNSKVAFIALNRLQNRNALGKIFISDLKSAILSVLEAKDVRCVVIGSLVQNIFCAGADLKEQRKLSEIEGENCITDMRNTFQLIAEIPVPTICAIDGPALGGGLELALSADLRYISENTLIGLVETTLALIPAAGGTQRLPRLIGMAKAKELIFTGKTVTGKEALEIGLVNGIVKQNSEGNAALLEAFSVAEEISENGPISVKMAKAAIDGGIQKTSIKDALLVEETFYAKVIPTSDRMEALSAFQEKRKSKFEGK